MLILVYVLHVLVSGIWRYLRLRLISRAFDNYSSWYIAEAIDEPLPKTKVRLVIDVDTVQYHVVASNGSTFLLSHPVLFQFQPPKSELGLIGGHMRHMSCV